MAFGNPSRSFIIEDPIEHIKSASGYESDDTNWEEVAAPLWTVQKAENLPHPELSQEQFEQHAQQVKPIIQPFLDVVASYQHDLDRHLAIHQSRSEHMEQTKQLITAAVGGILVNWDWFELFLLTFDEWLRQLAINPGLNMTAADWNELLNLVYVFPGHFYWTENQTATVTYIRQCGCEHYLYQNA